MKISKNLPVLLLAGSALWLTPARAQYPRVPADITNEATLRKAEANQRSDEAFARAMPAIKEWAAKGKPYLPASRKNCRRRKSPRFLARGAVACIRSAGAVEKSLSSRT